MSEENDIQRLKRVYQTVYHRDPADYSYTWHPLNPISIYYRQSQERALAGLLRQYKPISDSTHLLDIGCGNGGLLRYFANLGIPTSQLYGIDLMPDRITQARTLCPNDIHLSLVDARRLPYSPATFQLVTQFTVFSSIFDPKVRQDIAGEIERVLTPGGWLIWYDMYATRSANTRGIQTSEILSLFPNCTPLKTVKLHPIRASALARRSWFLCSAWERIPGIRKTHYLCLLQKASG